MVAQCPRRQDLQEEGGGGPASRGAVEVLEVGSISALSLIAKSAKSPGTLVRPS